MILIMFIHFGDLYKISPKNYTTGGFFVIYMNMVPLDIRIFIWYPFTTFSKKSSKKWKVIWKPLCRSCAIVKNTSIRHISIKVAMLSSNQHYLAMLSKANWFFLFLKKDSRLSGLFFYFLQKELLLTSLNTLLSKK